MTCKNCGAALSVENSFCAACGAKTIKDRITIKGLVSDLFQNVFGWDNKYFKTIKTLILHPGVLLREYVSGTRKKYMNPFSFLGIGVTLALFIFNIFSTQFVTITAQSGSQSNAVLLEMIEKSLGDQMDKELMQKSIVESQEEYSLITLKYFNLMILFFMPIYTLISFIVFGKPYNYAEHLIINCYIQGLSFLATSILFMLSLITFPSIYFCTIPLLIIYYTYAYGKLYQFSFKKAVLKLLKFLGVLLLLLPILAILAIVLGVVIGIVLAIIGGGFKGA